ncbi:hypothetical protein LP419_34135 [Massilia sp. H-1]|nr:hypothetical protein LP419_34135 [Massilia sp. H-1]
MRCRQVAPDRPGGGKRFAPLFELLATLAQLFAVDGGQRSDRALAGGIALGQLRAGCLQCGA